MRIIFLNPQGNFDSRDSYLTEHPDFGGQLVYVKELSLALADVGVNVDIITRRIDDPKWPGFSETLEHYPGYPDNPRIIRIACGGKSFLSKERLWPHLSEFVDNVQAFYAHDLPDFVTAHYADAGYCAVLLQDKTKLGFTFTGHSLGAQKLDKLGMTLENNESIEEQYRFSSRIAAERLSMIHAFKIITSTLQERFEQYGHALYAGAVDVQDDAKFSIIPPGVNTRIFSTDSRRTDDAVHAMIARKTGNANQPYIIASSRLDEKKNLAALVHAYSRSAHLRQRARLALFVRGVDDPFTDLTRLPQAEQQVLRPILDFIDACDIRDRVDFLSLHSQSELAAAYRYFAGLRSVFALTSLYEPFGLAPIEAAACGLAVVATENGGPSEIFSDGSAVLVDPCDEMAIGEALLKALDEQEDYAKRSQHRVESTYTWARTAQRYLSVIESGLTARTSGSAREPLTLDSSKRIRAYLKARDLGDTLQQAT